MILLAQALIYSTTFAMSVSFGRMVAATWDPGKYPSYVLGFIFLCCLWRITWSICKKA